MRNVCPASRASFVRTQAQYGAVTDWLQQCAAQPHFASVLGERSAAQHMHRAAQHSIARRTQQMYGAHGDGACLPERQMLFFWTEADQGTEQLLSSRAVPQDTAPSQGPD